MEELPFDVEIEILLRLQVQPLRRLELVSKQWRSLIRSRDFMERYLVHQKSKHRFTILAGVKVMDPFAHEVFREPRFIRYFHSSDGDPGFSYMLLQNNEGVPCLSCDGFICCPRPGNKFVFINPATRLLIHVEQQSLRHRPQKFISHLIILPEFQYCRTHILYHGMLNHQFSNLPCSSLLGFGRDRVSGDYKLVRLFEPPGENTLCTGCELFSLKARKWIYISHVPIPCFNGQPSASVNGSIYWFTAYLWLTDADQYSTTAKIIAFDLHTHRFRAVHHPPFGASTKPSYRIHLVNLRDQVWIVEQQINCLEMWSMDRGGDAWGKMYSIDLRSHARTSLGEVLMPIEICRDGKVLINGNKPKDASHLGFITRLLKYDPRTHSGFIKRLLKYDPRTKTFAYGSPYFKTWVLAPYFQSLFSFDTIY